MNDLFQKKIEALIHEGIANGAMPAAACAVGVGDTVLGSTCAGEWPIPGGKPVDEHTRWDMASMSKILGTTMIALQAIEEGKLRLTDTLADYYPDCPEDKRGITVYQLMTHTSGMHPSWRMDLEITDPADVMECILRHPLVDEPGAHPHYSCMGFITLAHILEMIYGAPLKELARERVFVPLGMDETCYCPDPSVPCVATEVDAETGKPWIGVVHDENARFQGGNSGNAGVFMSLKDGILYAQCLAAMGRGVLKRETMEDAIRNRTLGEDTHRGLGFHVCGTPLCAMGGNLPARFFGHTGFTGTSTVVDPETGFWVVLLANRVYPTRANELFTPFRKRVHEELWKLCEEQLAKGEQL